MTIVARKSITLLLLASALAGGCGGRETGFNKAYQPPPLKVEGLSVTDAAREMFLAMQAGRVDRGRLGDDFNFFLTDAKLQAASTRLRPLGAPAKIELETSQERGGMEQSTLRLSFGDGTKLEADMFRSVDGKVQQFLINKP